MTRIVGMALLVVFAFTPLVYGGGKLDINTAAEKKLINLPGIGQVIAKRIIEYRESNGDFNNIEELIKVKGIGEKRFEKIKDLITVKEKE